MLKFLIIDNSFRMKVILIFLFSCLFASMPVLASKTLAATQNNHEKSDQDDYIALSHNHMGFIAATRGGRIDWISEKGSIIKTKQIEKNDASSLIAFDNTIVVAFKDGSIYYSDDNENFEKVAFNPDTPINTLTLFKGRIIAGGNFGTLLVSDEQGNFNVKQLPCKGHIVSLSANNARCFGVTNTGEIIHTENGTDWTLFDYNEYYKGYYLPCSFKKVLVSENQISIIGLHEDNTPAVVLSAQGNVWNERSLNYTDQEGLLAFFSEEPNDIYDDAYAGQLVIVFNNGKAMILPSCSHCNELLEFEIHNLYAIDGNGTSILIVGESNYVKAIPLN